MRRTTTDRVLDQALWGLVKWYVRRRIAQTPPVARLAAGAAVVGLLVTGGAAVLARGDDDPET